MKRTLLEIVQDMLTATDSENVTSVSDTEEAGMCVNMANRAYEDMISGKRWKHLRKFTALSAYTYLNTLVPPTGTVAVDPLNLWYNGSIMMYIKPDQFLTYTQNRSGSNVTSINSLNIYNDRDPVYFTSDNDTVLVFDAIPSAISGLDASLSMCIAWVAPTSRLTTDSQIFNLPGVAFPTFQLYCKALAIGELKGDTTEMTKQLREYKRALGALARNARLVDKADDTRDFIVPRRSFRQLWPLQLQNI